VIELCGDARTRGAGVAQRSKGGDGSLWMSAIRSHWASPIGTPLRILANLSLRKNDELNCSRRAALKIRCGPYATGVGSIALKTKPHTVPDCTSKFNNLIEVHGLGLKGGIFVLVTDRRMPKDCVMETRAANQLPQETGRFRRIGFLVFPDCEILDVSGPFEAFFFADHWLGRLGRTSEAGFQSVVIAAAPGTVRTMSGMEIVATHSYSEIIDGLDTLVVAGGFGVEQASKDEALLEWMHSIAPRARRVASICSGAFILAAAGLLHQRRITTHWMFSDLLAAEYPSIEVDASRLFIRDGNIYTSGGITAGIDLALALIEEDVGQDIMLAVARTMVVFPRRPGGQSQFSAYTCLSERTNRQDISQLRIWMMANPAADLSVQALADRMAMSPRNFSRLFHSEMGEPPAQFAEKVRAEAARCMLEQTVVPIETIAKEAGFGDPERMRRTFQRLYDISPADYRARFRSTEIA
jgi:transcriptional regulator GlxA family with amidase domain